MPLRIAGHPLHPALVHFPLALWLAAVFWDLVSWWRPDPLWWQMAYWCLALGLVVSLAAIATGFVEYAGLAPEQPGIDAAATHMLVMVSATAAFGASWLLRAFSGSTSAPSPWAIALGLGGAALLAAGGWLGGTLVYRHGMGRTGHDHTPSTGKR
jgi:uncharacterized membrane protein